MLLDQYGNKIRSGYEIATLENDIDFFTGWLNYFENPDPVINTEANGEGIKLYDIIEKDPHAFSVLQTRRLSVVGKEWGIIPADYETRKGRPAKETQEMKIAKFVERVFMDCNFDQMREELLRAILYGYYGSEIIWKVNDTGEVVIDKFIGKHPRRFVFNKYRELRLLTPDAMIEGISIPDKKFLIFSWGDSDNPYGKGLGQKLHFYVKFKKGGIKFWLIFMEKFGMPTMLGKYNGAIPDQKDKLLAAMRAVQANTGIAVPEEQAIDLLEATRSGDGSYKSACEYFDKQISKCVLGQVATTEGTPGRLGHEAEQDDTKQDLVEADADLLDAYLNKTVIPWIIDWNFTGVKQYPKLITYTGKKPDLGVRSEIDQKNIDNGVKIPTRYFYETYGYPVPEPGEEVVERATVTRLHKLVDENDDNSFSESKFTPDQQAIENLISSTREKAKPVFNKLTIQIKKLTEGVSSLEELRDKIFTEYSHMDVSDLSEILSQAMMMANLHGRAIVVKDITKEEKG